MGRTLLSTSLLLLLPLFLAAQPVTQVAATIDPTRPLGNISPFIFGSNGQSDDRDENIAARRLGGNRLTGYNWENNASNAGSDYLHQSDNYLTYQMPDSVQHRPGIVLTAFHDVSVATNCYSLITLPAAGYVARDFKGTVVESETAPSSRWNTVQFAKGSAFSLQPDTSDRVVYVDEEVNMLVDRYGGSASPHGVHGYAVDNEPGLWSSTHPRLHPAQPAIAEVIDRGIQLARAVKSVDAAAEIFGPVSYGFAEYQNFQMAPDWAQYRSYGTFLDAYLAKMKDAEAQYGVRLIDVLDLHWYPEALGQGSQGKVRVALSDNAEPDVARARMQAPRTLWDSSYAEDSWIGQYFSPVALLPRLRAAIDRNYPGTRLAFTEINYGGDHHVSGGIAMADVFGIMAKYGVYMTNYWGPIVGYVSSAYRIYRNYDGHNSTYGNHMVAAATSDNERSSVHASLDSLGYLHVMAINRSQTDALDVQFSISGAKRYQGGTVYGFDANDSAITALGNVGPIAGNRFTYRLPPLSVHHLILKPADDSSVEGTVADGIRLDPCMPNPVSTHGIVRYVLSRRMDVRVVLFDVLGREVTTLAEGSREAGENYVLLPALTVPAGSYYCRLDAGGRMLVQKVEIVH
ncbi:MAG TPA: glycoside hydrolase family 44 protein [Candidatus Kapabacteria bacterium]|nr:glycoside hydrolase family 44 protein [Candidatus Kapabacteria bacterium]